MPQDDEAADLVDAAQVFRAKRTIDDAVGHLIARPLDEAVADQMRAVLDSPDIVTAREAWSRMRTAAASVPRLRLVAEGGETQA